VHGGYIRRLADAAVSGTQVVLELSVRRFRCINSGCKAVTFAEQVTGLTTPHSRYTPLLRGTLTDIGLAMAGRAGSRLAGRLGITVGRDVLLRLVRAIPEGEGPSVRILGVDDFAFRRGHRYGTILVDLETRKPIDMFDGRDGESLAAWLREHPEVEVICRDRAGGYGEGARTGAPQAIQVADRFHLWKNLGEAVEKTVNEHRAHLVEPSAEAAASPEPPPVVEPLPEKKIVKRLRNNYADVQELRSQGLSKAAIGRKLGLHPATVRKFCNARSVDDLIAKTEQRAHIVDIHTEYLHRRWNEGERNATQLFREIVELGYKGGELAVQRYLRRFREGRGHTLRTGPKPPSIREVTGWMMRHPDSLDSDAATALKKILARDPELSRLVDHVRSFAIMMVNLDGGRLEEWITAVENDTLPPLTSFARNLRRDLDAVCNGLTLTYSSGPVEGSNNRLKMLKRQMFGRASLDLLRKRVLFTQ
jgi:transposase